MMAGAPVHVLDLGTARAYTRSDAGAQLTGVQVVVQAGTARQTTAQNGLAALAAETVLYTTVDGVTARSARCCAGGSVNVAVSPDVVRFAIEALPDRIPDRSPPPSRPPCDRTDNRDSDAGAHGAGRSDRR